MEKTDLRLGKVNYSCMAYEYLLKEILSQRLLPGQPLRPERIASAVNLSPTPIKHALARLAGEGLVDLRAGQCPRVSNPTMEEILEMYDLRSLFETRAILQGIGLVDDQFLTTLCALVSEFADSVATRGQDYESRRRTAEIDAEIHLHIISLWPNRRAQTWYRQMNLLLRPLNLSSPTDSDLSRSVRRHRAIYEALCARDAEGAAEAARQHIANSAQTFLESVGTHESGYMKARGIPLHRVD